MQLYFKRGKSRLKVDCYNDINDWNKVQKIVIDLYKNEQITQKQFETIIDMHGFLGRDKKTRKEIADEKGCSLQNIGFLYRKALNKIREELIKQNVEYVKWRFKNGKICRQS